MSEQRSLKNIVIVGGGTAGWMTALYAQKVLPNSTITVVESDEIGILGAGEGATPHFINFLDFVNIPVSLLVKEASATLKNGIKFTNWNNDGSFYYHSFFTRNSIGFDGCNIDQKYLSIDAAVPIAWSREEKLYDIDFVAKVSEKSKVTFVFNTNYTNVSDPILQYDSYSHFSVHFNASKLATSFKKIAQRRGVKIHEGILDSVEKDVYGDIVKIKLKNGDQIDSDFVFDCSGFSRLLIGNHYKSSWKSHSESLPVNAAVPFFIPLDEAIPAYTEAIAMKYGWVWKIPTQERYGCGYVYDSSLISEEEAVKEIEEYLGFEPEYPRKNKGGFSFEAGYFSEPFKGNCIAIGLASGFIEPLEATSIWVSIMSLQNALSNLSILTERSPELAKDYNKKFCNINNRVVNFIYFHYMSDRKDTVFWNKFKSKTPEYVENLVQQWDVRLPQYIDHLDDMWSMNSWMSVGEGINKINKTIAKTALDLNSSLKLIDFAYDELKLRQDLTISSCLDHREFLGVLKGGI